MLAIAVIATEIPRVCGDLIEIRLRCGVLSFQFKHDDRTFDEEDHIWSA